MDILDPCCDILTNREVWELLRTNPKGNLKNVSNLATITYETTSYLETTPAATCTSESIAIFEKACKEKNYELSKIELIQLINLTPQIEIELSLIIDNLDERFDEEQKNELIELVKAIKVCNMPNINQDETIPRKKMKLS